MSRLLVLAAATLALLGAALSSPAPAQSPACMSIDAGLAMVEAGGGTNVRFLEGTSRDRAAAIFNQLTGTAAPWTVVALVDGPDGFGAVFVGVGPAFCARAIFYPEAWSTIANDLLGPPV